MAIDKAKIQKSIVGCINALSGESSLQVCFATKTPRSLLPSLYRVDITTDLAQSFKVTTAKTLADLNASLESDIKDIQEYNAGTIPAAHEIEIHTPEETSSPNKVVESLSDIANLPRYEKGKKGQTNFSFYVLAISTKDGPAGYAFRKYSKTKEITRTGKILAFMKDGVFNKISDAVFQFDDHIDCLFIDKNFIILNQSNYHYIFQFFEDAIEHSRQTLADIKSKISIENFEQFEKDCTNHPIIMMKLRAISQSDHVSTLDMPKIEKIIEKFSLPIEVAGAGGARTIVYKPEHKWQILKLLDDAYLQSPATDRPYEAVSKRALKK